MPIAGAAVHATPVGSAATRTSRTTDQGVYRMLLAVGDYDIVATNIGYRPASRRVSIAANGPTSIVDFHLEPLGTPLDTVVSIARRVATRAPLTAGSITDFIPSVDAGVSGDLSGQLASTAALLPGVVAASGGFSVLGLPAGMNSITLGGLYFAGTSLPPLALSQMRLTTATGDATAGGFAGGRMDVAAMARGRPYRVLRGSFDDPRLQGNAAQTVARLPGFRQFQLDGSMSDRIGARDDQYGTFYSLALHAGRHTTPSVGIDDAPISLVEQLGIDATSVETIRQAATAFGLPVDQNAGDDRLTNLSGLAELIVNSSVDRSWSIIASGAYDERRLGAGIGAFSATRTTGADRSGTLVSAFHHYFGGSVLSTIRLGGNVSSTRSAPDVVLPRAMVRVASGTRGTGGIRDVALGGGRLPSATGLWDVQAAHELTWFTTSAQHRIVVGSSAMLRGENAASATDAGTFFYSSLDRFSDNVPTTFSRLTVDRLSGRGLSLAISASDEWSPHSSTRVTLGARMDYFRFLERPPLDSALAQQFDAFTNATPGSVEVSPRVALTHRFGDWTSRPGRGAAGAAEMALGVGRYVAIPSTGLFVQARSYDDPAVQNGLTVCEGADVPAANWNGFLAAPLSIPTECAHPTAPTAPVRAVFERDFSPASKWQANASLLVNLPKQNAIQLGVVQVWLVDVLSTVDLNTRRTAGFFLDEEGQRPVLVPDSSVNSSTGSADPAAARVSATFGRVSEHRSDLRGSRTELSVGWNKVLNRDFARRLRVTYTYLAGRDQARGFGSTTAGDPWRAEWHDFGRRHMLTGLMNLRLRSTLDLDVFGRVTSGAPYSPMVAGDVNADGSGGNDRAFVFGPDGPDSVLAASIDDLIQSAPRNAARCLATQRNTVAASNSCAGTPYATLNLVLSTSARPRGIRRWLQPSITVTNALGLADWLLHRGDAAGWGTGDSPDPVLLSVRGFDPAQRRFSYEVNPHFGRSTASRNLLNPFVVTLAITVNASWNPGPLPPGSG